MRTFALQMEDDVFEAVKNHLDALKRVNPRMTQKQFFLDLIEREIGYGQKVEEVQTVTERNTIAEEKQEITPEQEGSAECEIEEREAVMEEATVAAEYGAASQEWAKEGAEIAENEQNEPQGWNKERVVAAIDRFILANGHIPGQKEYRAENNLPSYKAAKTHLEQSPALFCIERYDILMQQLQTGPQEETEEMSMDM